jgi:5'(3')-deoxyribonucleotidase
MKISPHEIGFDLDGVIADTAATFIRLACEEHNYCSFSLEDITSFEVEDCLDIPTSLVDRIFTDILKDSLATGLEPMPGAIEVIGELAGVAPVTVITARPLLQPVRDWFDSFFPGNIRSAITLIAMGDHNDKARYIHEHSLKYFVDDRAETCRQLKADNITPLVFSQPWNRSSQNLLTVTNWQEIRGLIDL